MRKLIATTALTLLASFIPATAALADSALLSQGEATWTTSQTAGHPGSNANDGSAATSWEASSRRFPAKWQVDLGARTPLAAMTVQWPAGAHFTYTIAGSNDRRRYRQLASGTGAYLTGRALAGSYRYVLVTITGSPSGSRPAILEARVFTTTETLPAPEPSPLPTPSATPTPTPTPEVVPAPAAPSPTPAPIVGASAGDRGPQATSMATVPPGWRLVQNQTISTMVLSSGQSNVVYDNVTFTGGTSSRAVVTITRASNIVFRNCTFTRGGGWNSVSINDERGSVRNITFDNCRWLGAGRMNIEITSRPTSASAGYSNVDITDSVFEPSGSESVSYDGGPAAGNSLFRNNLIKGAGNSSSQRWGAGLEINGPSNMVVSGNEIWQTRDSAFNFQRHTSAPSGWVVRDNLLDATRSAQSTPQDRYAQQVICLSVVSGTFTGNRVVSAAPGGSGAYWSNSRNMDWSGTVWNDSRGGSYARPTQVNCSGNRL